MATAATRERATTAVVEHTDPRAWDELIAGLGGQPFQAWAWGELKSRFGWQPYRFSSADGRSAAQVLIRPFRGLAVAYVPRGPVGSQAGYVDEQLLDHIVGLARSRRAAFLRFEPDVLQSDRSAEAVHTFFTARGFRTAELTLGQRSSIRLDLSPPTEELFASFSKGHRADIKRAAREGVQVRTGSDMADAEALQRMLAATAERKSVSYHAAAYYHAMCAAFGDSARIFLAEHDGEVVAGSMILSWGDNGLYLFAGSNRRGLETRAGHLLQWQAIQWARERGNTTWDLWGISDARGKLELLRQDGVPDDTPEMKALAAEAESDPKDRLQRFKKGWGGYIVRALPAYDKVFIPPVYWLWARRRGED